MLQLANQLFSTIRYLLNIIQKVKTKPPLLKYVNAWPVFVNVRIFRNQSEFVTFPEVALMFSIFGPVFSELGIRA